MSDDLEFRRSSFCSVGACVEVAVGRDGDVRIRGSRGSGAALSFTHDEWVEFLAGVKAGEFDPPVPPPHYAS